MTSSREIKTELERKEGQSKLPVMAAVAERKKVVTIDHFSPCFYLQSLKFFLFVRSSQKQFVCIDCTENQRKIGPSQMS